MRQVLLECTLVNTDVEGGAILGTCRGVSHETETSIQTDKRWSTFRMHDVKWRREKEKKKITGI